ncbi:5-methyltetrahydropteroyltriglutamate--homocysteine S-methyltransferase [Riemerella anatipestifer]|uniref:5-methyltetrahydropteroyltriglutamate--homocysteine methyltransferase n=1 Tax=Riemerella anatipestifer (strain ATCC 11845 / DSM 15868 / JCM 9532 / NCTC 11014) TaxID=693978 RepID=E4T9J7_RIEAD|nr:5-methyltetrahydropteroyltriglutamate--homocysteine S-methyltransferase [Riemerella anatipestifer]ADQ81678.1 methionine synthase (B12-independent) [Riemerella anatipestifer ATCC 11845 = DSM 15868]AFD55690.1 methionine synthase (b12-independent) [Riemerella anatipestifer ATCC 11845 = DSM 15868]AGC40414.1 Methionine synthase II (cobalamin-independent) [Riemerella anatipestifer RA-CH-2]AKP68930.1 methionine synthase II [Riemerella anatipestifer]AKP70798.1 methionine synthase II [Riemerella ana
MVKSNILGYPRIGEKRELKKANEQFWAGKITEDELQKVAKEIRTHNWKLQQEAGVDLVPSNDFSLYDQVLDATFSFNAIPTRYLELEKAKKTDLELYFALARGYQKEGIDITAMEMTKWFDTNYHYIVPEFTKDQSFSLRKNFALEYYKEAKDLGIETKPVLIGAVTYLLLGKEKEEGFHRLELLPSLLEVYRKILAELQEAGVEWVQIDEPLLVLDLDEKAQKAYREVYQKFQEEFPKLKIILTTYFEALGDNLELALSLPTKALHIDLVRAPQQLELVLDKFPEDKILSVGVVNGRNVWKNDFEDSLTLINKAKEKLGAERVFVASSSSLLHSPCNLELEDNEAVLTPEIKQWLAFAKQKVTEVATLTSIVNGVVSESAQKLIAENKKAAESRKVSELIHNKGVKERLSKITDKEAQRNSTFAHRRELQHQSLNLPLFPTTTIGSFPQTPEVRSWRAQFKKGQLTQAEYDGLLEKEIEESIRFQEDAGIDVLVHGEFERNDMVEYFGEQLEGFVFTKFGWVQSYGSRCVKPPIIFGDVSRPVPMTVRWSKFAQSLTEVPVKGMLTGPVTILQWSFVRDDQPRSATCTQIALAIRDEVVDLEKAGIKVIQIDEPAIREGLPLRKKDWQDYLQWAIRAFRISASGVQDATQIHTHMCYSEFNDIISNIADMDADVITIECSRSQMELLDVFADFKYPNEIGPGVYDIHSPRVPSVEEMSGLMDKAVAVVPKEQLWVNPDCGLKTRHWEETKAALVAMVETAKELRAKYSN